MIRILIVIALLLSVLAFATPVEAQRSPRHFLTDMVEDAQTLQDVELTSLQDGLLLGFVRHHFDTERMGKFVLGRYWRKATFEQRKRFLELFELVTVRRFGPVLQEFPFDSFRIRSVDDDDYNNIIVVSTIEKDDKIIKIKWRLTSSYFPEYQVIDITAEGVSLMLTLRAEYGSAIKQYGIEGVISRLENAV